MTEPHKYCNAGHGRTPTGFGCFRDPGHIGTHYVVNIGSHWVWSDNIDADIPAALQGLKDAIAEACKVAKGRSIQAVRDALGYVAIAYDEVEQIRNNRLKTDKDFARENEEYARQAALIPPRIHRA